MKRCSMCKIEKDESEYGRHSSKPDGLYPYCKSCVALWNRERKDYKLMWERAHPTRKRVYERKQVTPSGNAKNSYWYRREMAWRRYGILTVNGSPFLRADFMNYWEAQGGACAMCEKSFGPLPEGVRKVNVDHWHKKGKYGPVRALLCWLCNRRVGDLTYETAKPLWEYLSRFKPDDSPSSDSPPRAPQHASAPARAGA